MSETENIYRTKFTHIQEVPEPDNLISGWATSSPVTFTAEGEQKRGTLLMSSGDNEFVPATASGVKDAYELAVLCSDIDTEGHPAMVSAYFSGILDGQSLILPYETEEDVHSDLVEAIRPSLRRAGFMVV